MIANKIKIHREEALQHARDAEQVWVAKGKKLLRFDLSGDVTDEELATGASVALEIRRLLRGLGLMLVVLTVTLLLGFVPILNAITTPIGLALNFLLGASRLVIFPHTSFSLA